MAPHTLHAMRAQTTDSGLVGSPGCASGPEDGNDIL